MVGHYPTIKLIGREHIPNRKNFPHTTMRSCVISGINHRFRWLSQSPGQITHVLLTRSPLEYPQRSLSARLACVKHAASVRPEPGSNSPSKNNEKQNPSINKQLTKKQSICPSQPKKPPPPPKKEGSDEVKTNKLHRHKHGTLLSSQTSDTHLQLSDASASAPQGQPEKRYCPGAPSSTWRRTALSRLCREPVPAASAAVPNLWSSGCLSNEKNSSSVVRRGQLGGSVPRARGSRAVGGDRLFAR